VRARVDAALEEVEAAAAELAVLSRDRAPIARRRAAHARLGAAIDAAETALRTAVDAAKGRSLPEWTRWRRRLSRIRTLRQAHLFAERDDLGVLPIAHVRAFDTGMSGPAIGDLLHGAAGPAVAEPRYGLDLGVALTARHRPRRPVEEPRRPATPALPAAA